MALKVVNKKFLSLLPTGEVCSNELYYHAKCYKSLWNYVKSADEFYAALQKAMHLIRLEVIAQGNKFAGSFDI